MPNANPRNMQIAQKYLALDKTQKLKNLVPEKPQSLSLENSGIP